MSETETPPTVTAIGRGLRCGRCRGLLGRKPDEVRVVCPECGVVNEVSPDDLRPEAHLSVVERTAGKRSDEGNGAGMASLIVGVIAAFAMLFSFTGLISLAKQCAVNPFDHQVHCPDMAGAAGVMSLALFGGLFAVGRGISGLRKYADGEADNREASIVGLVCGALVVIAVVVAVGIGLVRVKF